MLDLWKEKEVSKMERFQCEEENESQNVLSMIFENFELKEKWVEMGLD